MDGIFIWLQETSLARFVNESPSIWGFPFFLFVHSIGLSLILGPCLIASTRVLGLARSLPMAPLVRLFPWMWLGFILTLLSGTGLAIANAQNHLTNPILLVKLGLVTLAVIDMWLLERKVFRAPAGVREGGGKLLAGGILVLWLAVLVAGRLIAYSRTIFEVI